MATKKKKPSPARKPTARAREDADRTAKGKTILVSHVREKGGDGTTQHVPPADAWVGEDGERIALRPRGAEPSSEVALINVSELSEELPPPSLGALLATVVTASGEARELAEASRATSHVTATYALDALWLALRREETGDPAPRVTGAFLKKLDALARAYLDTRAKSEPRSWPRAWRPARVGVDRDERVSELNRVAGEVALAGAPRKSAALIAQVMVSTMARLNVVAGARSQAARRVAEARLAKQIENADDAERTVMPDILVVWTLKAFGVSHVDANNWAAHLRRKPRSV